MSNSNESNKIVSVKNSCHFNNHFVSHNNKYQYLIKLLGGDIKLWQLLGGNMKLWQLLGGDMKLY